MSDSDNLAPVIPIGERVRDATLRVAESLARAAHPANGDIVINAAAVKADLDDDLASLPSLRYIDIDIDGIPGIQDISVQRAREWHDGHFGRGDTSPQNWTGADWSNAMQGEAGEAGNVVKKLRRLETNASWANPIKEQKLIDKLGEELADTFLYMVLLASYYGIDLEAAIVEKFNAVSEREGFPQRMGYGSGSYLAGYGDDDDDIHFDDNLGSME